MNQASHLAPFTAQPGVANGTVRAPSSKSVTHRAYLLAAHTQGKATVINPLRAADTDATLACLTRLGAKATVEGARVHFGPADWKGTAIDCKNSGTSLRLLLGLAARLPKPTRFDGDASLRKRPNAPLLDALKSGGARVTGADTLPIQIQGPILPGTYHLPAKVSSQYASALLLSLPFLPKDSTLHMDPPVSSRPYLDITTQTAAAFGIDLRVQGDTYHIPGNQTVTDTEFTVEGDWSGAAFPLAAAAISGGTVTVEGLLEDSPQGDRAILQILAQFGATITKHTVTGGPLVSPGTVNVSATPDLFPALAVVAACAQGTTQFVGGAALRHKECDRIRAMAQGLERLGIRVQEHPEGLEVQGSPSGLTGGTVEGFADHRIHMAFCIAGLVATGPVTVTDPEHVAISYPNFHQDLEHLTETP